MMVFAIRKVKKLWVCKKQYQKTKNNVLQLITFCIINVEGEFM